MTEPPLHPCPALDFAYHRSVVADAGVEAEVPAVHVAEPDGADLVGGDPVGQQPHCGDGIVGHPECSGEHIGAAARKRAEGSVGSGDAGGDFVQGSIAAESDDDVDPASGCILSESDRVTTAIRLDDLDVVALAEGAVYDHGVARRDRGGKRVDNQQDAQDSDVIVGAGPQVWSIATAR